MVSLRQTTKRVFEKVLRLTAGHPRQMAGRSLILAYHNVVPDGEQGRGDRSLHLPFSAFRRQLDLLQTHCQVSPLRDLLTARPFPGGPRIAITFDDAYRGAVELALPELEQRGLPSTMFVAPGLLGSRSLWWDEMATGPEGLPDDLRLELLERLAGREDPIRAGRAAAPGQLPGSYGCASEDQVRALGRLRQVTLGAHSWSHPNLARIDADDLATELTRPLDWLGSVSVPTLPVLAYPYGLCSPAVEEAAARAGYSAGLLVEGGWLAGDRERPFALPRFNVPAGLSEDGLWLRLAGRRTP
jgi:peptidoglycan/xylan/chitin deacetylase (PgdA/CDA1 family)